VRGDRPRVRFGVTRHRSSGLGSRPPQSGGPHPALLVDVRLERSGSPGCRDARQPRPCEGQGRRDQLRPYLVTPDELESHRFGKGYHLAMVASITTRFGAAIITHRFTGVRSAANLRVRSTTLRTGDVIGSGTVGSGYILEPSRVHGSDPFPWHEPGDRVRLEAQRLGAIGATITRCHPVVPLLRGTRPAAPAPRHRSRELEPGSKQS
jgi:hypothetical protein